MIDWETCKREFQWDGSWRDIYVTPASLRDWHAVYPFLRSHSDAEYSVDGDARSIPDSVDEIFELRQTASPQLRFKFGNILIVFHFFSTEEIECDIDPREILSQSRLNTLLGFMRKIGELTQKPVILTPENGRGMPIINYDPINQRFLHHPLNI